MPSFNAHLGLEPGPDGHSVVLDTRDEHLVAPGTVHFAVLATLAEVSAAQSVEATVVPASLQLQLMRRAEPGRLVGRDVELNRDHEMLVGRAAPHDIGLARISMVGEGGRIKRIGSDPSLATPEAGRRLCDAAVEAVIRDYQAFLQV